MSWWRAHGGSAPFWSRIRLTFLHNARYQIALRWLKTMVQEGLFIRRADPHDGRRVSVELAPETSQALRHYFAEVGKVAAI